VEAEAPLINLSTYQLLVVGSPNTQYPNTTLPITQYGEAKLATASGALRPNTTLPNPPLSLNLSKSLPQTIAKPVFLAILPAEPKLGK
jgi:hypothetical protein